MPISRPTSRARLWSRRFLAAVYLAAGVLHIAFPQPFVHITPAWVPHAETVIFITGICEILGALALMMPRTRRIAGLALAAYAVCVFPANIKHASEALTAVDATWIAYAYHLPRLVLQPVFIWWAFHAGEVTDWPFRQETETAGGPEERGGGSAGL